MAEARHTTQKAGGRTSTAAPQAAPAAAGSMFDAWRASAGASRFAWVRSELATPFTWASPLVSGAAFSVVGALFLAHVALGFSLASIASHVAVIAIVVAAAIHLHNTLQPQAALPQLSLPLDRASVSQLGVLASDRLNLVIERVNAVLSWEHPLASARALAYAWLSLRFAWLAAPGWVLTASLLAFVATPAYLQFQRLVDAAVDNRLMPVVQAVAKQIMAVEASASAAAAANATTAALGAAVAGVVSLWLFWGAFSFSGLFTLASLAVAARDALVSATAEGAKRD